MSLHRARQMGLLIGLCLCACPAPETWRAPMDQQVQYLLVVDASKPQKVPARLDYVVVCQLPKAKCRTQVKTRKLNQDNCQKAFLKMFPSANTRFRVSTIIRYALVFLSDLIKNQFILFPIIIRIAIVFLTIYNGFLVSIIN